MHFYIKSEGGQQGPFDLVVMIRKIRNGELQKEQLVLEEADEKAVPAAEHPKLAAFYQESQNQPISDGGNPYLGDNGYAHIVSKAMELLQQHPTAVLFSAGYFFLIVLTGAIFAALLGDIAGIFMGWLMFHFLTPAMQHIMQQFHKGQQPDLESVFPYYNQHLTQIIVFSVIIAVLTMIGGAMLVLPGLALMSLFAFAPLLVIHQRLSAWDALMASKTMVLQHGRKMFELLFGLTVLNFFGAILFLIPLVLTIPITYFIITDLYQQMSLRSA